MIAGSDGVLISFDLDVQVDSDFKFLPFDAESSCRAEHLFAHASILHVAAE